jgi:hypothetical protein
MMLGALVTLGGCGRSDTGREPTFPTRGAITFEGKPIGGAFLALHPRNPSPAGVPSSTAHVLPDGTFELSTYESGDGAPAGNYIVTVQWHKLMKNHGDFVPGPNLLPRKYSSPDTSNIVIEVAAAANVLPVISLKR